MSEAKPIFGINRYEAAVVHTGKAKSNPMLVYGIDPEGHKCKTCDHLIKYQMGQSWFKCDLRVVTSSRWSDHNATWPACSKYVEATDGT